MTFSSPVAVTAGATYVRVVSHDDGALRRDSAGVRVRVRQRSAARTGEWGVGRQRCVRLRRKLVPQSVVQQHELLGRRHPVMTRTADRTVHPSGEGPVGCDLCRPTRFLVHPPLYAQLASRFVAGSGDFFAKGSNMTIADNAAVTELIEFSARQPLVAAACLRPLLLRPGLG